MLFDRDGDAANTGTGFGKPAKDLSINFVPVPYPDYRPAVIEMKPEEQQLWRVVNASGITYLNLEVLFGHTPQPLGLVAMDGVPLNENGLPRDFVDWQTHLGVPPGARVEFIVKGPPEGVSGLLVTKTVDTGAGGENDPNRAIATITASKDAPEPPSELADLAPTASGFADAMAGKRGSRAHSKALLFREASRSERSQQRNRILYDRGGPNAGAVRSQSPGIPNIIAKQGTVEDWIIENRSSELHTFHIHQLHFMLLDYRGKPVNEPFLRDTVNVPYYDGKALEYPSVRLRMDFRDPNTVGDFVYHCHLLEHEDGGMMGLIRVEP